MDAEQHVEPAPALRPALPGFVPWVIVPTFDNARTLESVVRGALQQSERVLVVDDGSTDDTPRILSAIDGIVVVRHASNRGKGAALASGFAAAFERGGTHAITLDSDGQHPTEQIASFVAAARATPAAIVLGNRDLEGAGAGRGSRYGRTNSNFWTWVETGHWLPDTQTGFRGYPLRAVLDLHLVTTGFDYELEVLVKASWSGVELRSIPIEVRYFQGDERVSHMKPVRDFLRIGRMNVRLVTMRLCLPGLYLKLVCERRFRALPFRERWRESIVELFLVEPGSPRRIAASAGFGFFMGLTPIWGFQIVTLLFLAHRLKLSKTVALLSSHISFPLLVPFIVYASLVCGRFVLGTEGDVPLGSLDIEPSDVPAWIVGSVLLASAAGVVGGALVYFAVHAVRQARGWRPGRGARG